MHLEINMQARLKRHSRNLHSLNKHHFLRILRRFKLLSLVVILILPIYPSFGEAARTETAVGNYDASSIILSYEGDDGTATTVFSRDSGFVRPVSFLSDARDTSGMNQLMTYTVKSGDSFASIANKFRITEDSIVWANNLSHSSTLKPGQTLQIPPVSGSVYHVNVGDSVQTIASAFGVDSAAIVSQNNLVPGADIHPGDTLIIPGASRVLTMVTQPTPTVDSTVTTQSKPIANAKAKTLAQKVSKKSKLKVASIPKAVAYAMDYTGEGTKFAWGNCTYFVANHKHITWRGNANEWLSNAAAAGVPTGNKPVPGAIISFRGSGYNSYYGHVGLVVDTDGDDVIIKDMNYRRLNEVTIRRVSKDDPSIRGYIYTD